MSGEDVVIMPPPNDDDMWNHSFIGRIVGERGRHLTSVEDQDGNVFDIETSRLEVVK